MSQTLDQRIVAETTEYENIVQKLDDILNGDVNAVITVTSGDIPSIRKAVNDALNNLATASATNLGTTITEINTKITAIETYLGDETNPDPDTVRRLLIDLRASVTTINNNIGDLAADDPQGSGTIAERLGSARQSGGGISQATWDAARVGLPADSPDSANTASLWARLGWVISKLGGANSPTIFYYFSSFTATQLTEASLNSAGIYAWLTRFSNSIKNLADNLGNSSQTASSTGTLWQQFLQLKADVLSGSGGGSSGVTQAAFNILSDAVGLATNAANIAGSTLWAQFNQIKEWVGTRPNLTVLFFENPSSTILRSSSLSAFSIWQWIAYAFGTTGNINTRLTTLSNRNGDRPSTTYYYFASFTTTTLSSASAATESIWAWLTRFSTSIKNLGDRLASLVTIVGTRPSITYYYFATLTTTTLSSANANTQAAWTWITRLSNSIKNLGDRLATLTSQVGDKLDTSTWTAARVGTPADTADADTDASLWAQFKQSLANAGSGGGISQTTFDALANAVGLIGDAAAITSTRLWAQFNQVKAWLGSPSGNLSYYADQNTSSISSAGASSQSVWTWLTRFSFSIRNLKNRKLDTSTFTDARVGNPGDAADSATTASLWAQVKNLIANPGSGGGGGGVSQATFQALANAVGAVADAANIAGTTLWNRMNQVTAWLGVRPTSAIPYYTTSTTSGLNNAAPASIDSIWGWLRRLGISIQNLHNKHNSQQSAISALQTQVGNIDTGTASDRPAQYTEKINIQDGDLTLPNESGVETALADLGYQENDLVRNPVPKLFRVRGSHLPLDHPMRVTSTDTDIAISNSYHLYGWAKAVIPELTNATSGTIAEVDNAATQDIGDQLVAILNMSSLSTIDGKFIIVMSRPSASNDGFVPDELTIKIGDSPMRVFANVDEYHRTATHIFYQTSQAFESGLGINPLFGDSQVGQAVNFDVGIKNAEGNNFLLSAATTLYLQEILIDRVSTTSFGKLVDIPAAQDKALGSRYDTDDGETYIVKEKAGHEKYVIPAPVGNEICGQTNKSRGALSGTKNIEECAYDFANEHWRISFDDAASIQAATQLKVWKDGWGDVKGAAADTMKLIVPPESETHGAKLKLAGTIIPRSDAAKITAANFGANITRDGNSVNRFVGADGSNGTFPSGANLEGWFFDRQEDWLQADVERSNHTQIKNWIVGQKLTPQVTGQVVHYREQQTNEGNLGSRNANHQIGLYEMKLSFGNSDRDETYLHLPIANADVASNQKLVVFLHRKNASNSNPDFIDMEHRDGFMFDLEYSRAISDVAYPRYKWRIAASQNLGASLEALAGDWYVGVAIMTTATIATDVHDLVESWIPKAYTKLYFEGVQLPVENLVISRNSDDNFIFSYRSGQYSNAQRDLFYASGTAENQKDIMVSGQQYVFNLINADGGTHIPMKADMAQHIKEFDHFKVDVLNSSNASVLTETTQKFWQRLARADAGEIVHRGLDARAPIPHHLNQKAVFTTGQGGSFRAHESISMYNRFDTAPYFNVVLPLANPTSDSVWSVTPEMWRHTVPNLAGVLGGWSGSLMRIDIPTVANSRVLLYVLTDNTNPSGTEMGYLDMRGREWDDITLDSVADFARATRRLAHDDANNRSYFCHVLDHATTNSANMFANDANFYSFILGVWNVTSAGVFIDRSDVKPRKTLEYVNVR